MRGCPLPLLWRQLLLGNQWENKHWSFVETVVLVSRKSKFIFYAKFWCQKIHSKAKKTVASLLKQISNDVKCMYECQEVSNIALHNFPRPQTFKEEPGSKKNLSLRRGIWTHDLRIRSPWATRPSWEQVVGIKILSRGNGNLCIVTNVTYRVALDNEISNDINCMYECQEKLLNQKLL